MERSCLVRHYTFWHMPCVTIVQFNLVQMASHLPTNKYTHEHSSIRTHTQMQHRTHIRSLTHTHWIYCRKTKNICIFVFNEILHHCSSQKKNSGFSAASNSTRKVKKRGKTINEQQQNKLQVIQCNNFIGSNTIYYYCL